MIQKDIFTEFEINTMQRVLELALLGKGKVEPNPYVGSIICIDDKIISEAFHSKFGEAHAEVNAIYNAENYFAQNNINPDFTNATIYVNLEPCSHFGKTPPCANLIIEKKFKNVIIAMQDPNPLVLGKGIKLLKNAGINVRIGLLEKDAQKLNEVFISQFH